MPPILLTVVQGDKEYDLNFTLTDSQGVAIDITSGVLTFNAQLKSDPDVQISGNITIVNAPIGSCKYTVQSTDFVVTGTYDAQIRLSLSSGAEVVTFSGITVTVLPRIPI